MGFVLDLDALTDLVHRRAAVASSKLGPEAKLPELTAGKTAIPACHDSKDRQESLSHDSSRDRSELFVEALQRRAKGERVSLKLGR